MPPQTTKVPAENIVRTAELIGNTFSDGSTSLSRDGQVVYRGLGVGAFGENVIVQCGSH